MDVEKENQETSYFQDASVNWNGETFYFSAADGKALEHGSNYWNGAGSRIHKFYKTYNYRSGDSCKSPPPNEAFESGFSPVITLKTVL